MGSARRGGGPPKPPPPSRAVEVAFDIEVDERPAPAPTPAPAPAPAPAATATAKARGGGRRFGHFVIGEPLGRGRMGVVFAAHDERLDRQVALKILAGDRSSPAERLRLLGAAQALARLSHPNIVAAHEAGEIDGQIYLSMELVHGVPLPTWLKKQPRRWKEIVRVFIAAGRGLAAAHAAGMVHGDFTPGEVLVGDDGRVRVTDFGLTIAVEASAGEQAELRRSAAHLSLAAVEPAGTPCYMPPERLRGGEADVRGDVFALSVALFEALFGARPFVGRTVSERLSELMSARPILIPPQPRIPTWLDR
ncbi:MAG: serine/threonine protein kinase, partial [Myxococcales bacterium]|nr:serine/threonine protein kinase [Myxococcales bacterium]